MSLERRRGGEEEKQGSIRSTGGRLDDCLGLLVPWIEGWRSSMQRGMMLDDVGDLLDCYPRQGQHPGPTSREYNADRRKREHS